ncbi:MAG: hypothetical protein LKJ25_01010 [Clostridia bacterium]|jgi:hypothetical protein|nr:hypothetical protein [Clostridia bacterium]
MIKTRDIFDAINREIVKVFPDYTVYIDTQPKDFKRPSFLLSYLTTTCQPKGINTVEKSEYFLITVFINADELLNSDTTNLLDIQNDVLDIFSVGVIQVQDRFIAVSASASGRDEDVIYIDLQFTFFDERGIKQKTSETAEKVITNYIERNE